MGLPSNVNRWVTLGLLPAATQLVPCVVQPAAAVTYLSTESAQKILFENAARFEKHPIYFTDEQRQSIEKRSGDEVRVKGQQIWKAYREDSALLGFFIVDYVIGKHELIDYAVALTPRGEVLGVEVLAYREAYGSEVRQKGWRKHFVGKKISDPIKLGQDIPHIGGATLSCRHVTDGVRRILAIYELILSKDPAFAS